MFEYIQDAGLKFTSAPQNRKATNGIVIHHRAGFGDVVSEHNDSLSRGWIGIGYNLYVRQDGTVWMGRGLDAIGAHAGAVKEPKSAGALNNQAAIGIGFEGYYQSGSTLSGLMPKVQFDAGVRLLRDLLIAYPTIGFIKGHKEMPSTATVCPGDAFPLADMVKAAYAVPEVIAPDGQFYCVQVGAYTTLSNANALQKQIGGYIILKDTINKTYKDN